MTRVIFERTNHAVILSGVSVVRRRAGTQSKDAVELPATAIPLSFTSLAAEFRHGKVARRNAVEGARGITGEKVFSSSPASSFAGVDERSEITSV